MYRRRRITREKIVFSFDSFLDVVANVIGIVIRLILVAWVGARTYSATMTFTNEPALPKVAALPAPKVSDDPLSLQIEQTRLELDDARAQLSAALAKVDQLKTGEHEAKRVLATLVSRKSELDKELALTTQSGTDPDPQLEHVALGMNELRNRGETLAEQIKALENIPPNRKELRYHAPVSQVVSGDEIFFECQANRVTFIDLPAFMDELHRGMEGVAEELRNHREVLRTTSVVGAFRLVSSFAKEQSVLDSPASFRYGLARWELEPVTVVRGETTAEALAPSSSFHRIVDRLDAHQGAVTFWVYPDSFEIFRRLRDVLYERGIEVAGRPLPVGGSIAASQHGSRSRGQ